MIGPYDQNTRCKELENSRLGVVVVWMDIDVPQTQLMQLANDLLHGIHVLIGHSVQGAGAGGGSRHLGVGEVQKPRVACARNDLVHMLCTQVRVPVPAHDIDCQFSREQFGMIPDDCQSIISTLQHIQSLRSCASHRHNSSANTQMSFSIATLGIQLG